MIFCTEPVASCEFVLKSVKYNCVYIQFFKKNEIDEGRNQRFCFLDVSQHVKRVFLNSFAEINVF